MVNKIIEKITDPYSLISSLGVRGLFNWMSDEKYLKMLWRLKFHKSLNLDNPQTFNEKLQLKYMTGSRFTRQWRTSTR